MNKFVGLSYEQASRVGDKIMKESAQKGNWCLVLDDLLELRQIMQQYHDVSAPKMDFNILLCSVRA